MAVKRNQRFLIGIAVALVLPLSFYIIAKALDKDKLAMPVYYNVDQKIPSRDAMKLVRSGALKPVADLEGFNQFGDRVSLNKDLPGKMLVVNFIFTACKDACPKLTGQMKTLSHAYRRTPKKRSDTTVQFVSISVDPSADSPGVLRAYAKAHSVDENHWWFITGDKRRIYDWARTQLHLSVPAGDGGADDFIHSNQIVLLDRERFVRGYYNGLDSADVGRCAYELGLLAMEKKR